MKTPTYQALFFLASLFSESLLTGATPFPPRMDGRIRRRRDCTNPCGFYKQMCCAESETCSTDANGQPVCSISPPQDQVKRDGGWEYWTSTYVQTDLVTVTSTGSRHLSAPTAGGNSQCRANLGETPCGGICCSAAQACESEGQCTEAGSTPFESEPGPQPTPPSRPTSTSGVTVTATVPFIPAVGTDGTTLPISGKKGEGTGLSGGAIAGIVIGSLIGVGLLIILCACCCVGSCIDRTRAVLGLTKTRSSSYTGTSSSRSSRRRPGRTWWGHKHSSTSSSSESRSDKKHGLFGLGKFATFGLVASALAICLGLKKKHDKRHDHSEKSTTYYGDGSTYYDDYYTSTSSSSSSSRPTRSGRHSRYS